MKDRADPYDLLWAGRYEEALTAYDAQVAAAEPLGAEWANRGFVLMCLKRWERALEDLRRANARSAQDRLLRSPAGLYLPDVGVCLWLMGRRGEAIETMTEAVEGIRQRRIRFGDLAGGVGEGLLLWYLGLTEGDGAAQARAHDYLREKCAALHAQLASACCEFWPGPLALYVEEGLPFEQVLRHSAAAGTEVEACKARAASDILARRELCQALFYRGVMARSAGDEAACRAAMAESARLFTPLEMEGYLARAEVEGAT